MRQEMIERLNQRRWLVDEVRLVGPPQHFMSRKEVIDQRQAIMRLLNHAQGNPLHVYVHIPFCEEHCTFCMYFDQGAKEGSRRVQRYVHHIGGLLSYLRQLQGKKAIHALYVGGGTASILTTNQIQELFDGMTAYLHPDAQATFEMS